MKTEQTDILEEEEPLGSIGKTRHFTISRRDTIINDLKNSTAAGLVSFMLSVFSLILLVICIYDSYRNAGKSGMVIGIILFGAFVSSILAIIFGCLGYRNRGKIRHYMEGRGIVLGIIVLAALIALFVIGARSYFGN
ncbi:MAG: hypothetical protein IJM76_09000 [Lachnospiraceae bacterium]|nr:hypothetical protein [Lachnospiraceae bacterium]